MGQFSLAELFGMTIRESANDGSDFTNPAADYRRLFLGEDGLLHVKDSSGTVTNPYTTGSGTGQGLIDYAFAERTGGNVTCNSTTWANVDTGMDLVITAASGDRVEVLLSGGAFGTEAVTLNLTGMTIVSASPVNDIATRTTPSNTTNGIAAWRAPSSSVGVFGGGIIYALQSGDISGGTVTMRLRYRTASASNRVLTASDPALYWSIKNIGPAL